MPIPAAAVDHYKAMQQWQAEAVVISQLMWDDVARGRIVDSWAELTDTLTPIITEYQKRAALGGATYSALTLAQQGAYVAPSELADVAAFAGYASDGRPLDTLLQTVAYGTLARIGTRIGTGVATNTALDVASRALAQLVQTIIADAARQAAGVDIVTRPTVGYVRMLNPPSCARCAVLAGKFFQWNAGFLRHPGCDCVHVAATAKSTEGARREGLIDNQYEYFNSLTPEEQDATFTKAGAQAIRDGADINQVVNSRRGMTPNGNFTTEGTTRRGNASKNLKPGQRRMTPELIYGMNLSRAETLELLKYHGYILPGGQIPTGALRGQVQGFGQMGAGGRRAGAVRDIEKARATGVRDPRNRNTMTAAERRLYDAEQNYLLALSGISPYTSPGFGNTPDPSRQRLNTVGATTRPVTQTEMATAEYEYRRELALGGQRYVKKKEDA